MTREEFIESIVSNIEDKYARIEVKNELETHLDDRIDFYLNAGYDYDYALEKAIERMGDSQTVGLQMNALYSNKRVQTAIWILAILFSLFALFFRYSFYSGFFEDALSELFSFSSLIFHGAVLLFTIAFLLATKFKNYKALLFISIVNMVTLGRIFSYFGMSDAWYNSPLAPSILLFTHTSEIITSVLNVVFAAFGIYDTVYMLFAGIFGILFSAQIRLHLNGTAKTNILKRYQAYNVLTFIALSTEILSLIIFIVSFVFLMRS